MKKLKIEKPMLSIVMPVYNVAPFLDACLISVRYQTFSNFELIIVNDCSTDNGRKIIEMHMSLDSRIRLINLEHNTLGGAGIPSNIGIDEAIGKYITFVDSDDWVTIDAFENMIKAAEKYDSDLVIGGFRNFSEINRNYTEAYDLKDFNEIPSNTLFTARKYPHIFHISPVPWRKLYRRDVIQKNHIRYPEGDYFYEDNPLHWFTLLSYSRIIKINNIISYHRMNREGQTMEATGYKFAAVCCHLNSIGRFLYEKLTLPDDQVILDTFYESCFRKARWVLSYQKNTKTKDLVGKKLTQVVNKYALKIPPHKTRSDFGKMFDSLDGRYPNHDLTVVIPAFNSEDFITETVNSVLNTPNILINILIIDDGSQDKTVEICRKLEKKHYNIHFFEQHNKGAGRARNALIPLCTGSYTFFLDSDDIVNGEALSKAVIDAKNNNNDLYFMKYKVLFHDTGKEINMFNSDKKIWSKFPSTKNNSSLRSLAAKLINYPWNRIIKTDLLLDANIFFGPTVVHNDILFHWSSLLSAKNIGYSNLYVCTHRKFDNRIQLTNISDSRRLAVFDALLYTHKKILQHHNAEFVIDPWNEFVKNIIDWTKDKIPPELLPEFKGYEENLLKQISGIKE